jgi:hypothetical protein
MMNPFQAAAQGLQGMHKSLSECKARVNELESKYRQVNKDYELEVEDLKKGLFCSKCRGSKTSFEKRGEDFYEHVKDVQGQVIPATQEDFNNLSKKATQQRASLAEQRSNTQKQCESIEDGIRKAIIDENNRQIEERNRRLKEMDERQRAEYEERDRERREKAEAEEEARKQKDQDENDKNEFLGAVGFPTSSEEPMNEEESKPSYDFAAEAEKAYHTGKTNSKHEAYLEHVHENHAAPADEPHENDEAKKALAILGSTEEPGYMVKAKDHAREYVESKIEEVTESAKEEAIEELYEYAETRMTENQKTLFGFIKEKYEEFGDLKSRFDMMRNIASGNITQEDTDKYFDLLTPNKIIRTIQQKTTGKILEVRDRTFKLLDALGNVIQNFDSENNSTEELDRYFNLFR